MASTLSTAPRTRAEPRPDRAALRRYGLGALAVLGLLLTFGFVVRQVARQGDASRHATAMSIETTWRCKSLRSPGQRAECLRLAKDTQPADSAALRDLVSSVAASPPKP